MKILLFTAPLLGMGIDLIAPSLPSIVQDLNTSAAAAKGLISTYLLGYAFGIIFFGFLSDSWGRRSVLLPGLFLFSLSSLLPLCFPNINILLLTRFLQGFLIASIGLTRPIFVDTFHKDKLVSVLTWLATLWSLGSVVGPFIGGYLTAHFSWKACFIFFASFSFFCFFLLLLSLPETLQQKQIFSVDTIKKNLKEILTHRVFMGTVLAMAGTYATLLSFNTLGPFLIQVILNKSSIFFGYIALSFGLSFFFGTLTARIFLKMFELDALLYYTNIAILIVAISFLSLSLLYGTHLSLIIVHAAFIFFGIGVFYPTIVSKNSFLFRHLAGSASSLTAFFNLAFNSAATACFSFISIESSLPLAILFVCLLFIALVGYQYFVKERQ